MSEVPAFYGFEPSMPERADPRERIQQALSEVDEIIHEGRSHEHQQNERIVREFTDPDGVYNHQELFNAYSMDGENAVRFPALSITRGSQTATYYLLEENTVMKFAPSNDESPAFPTGTEYLPEAADAFEGFWRGLTDSSEDYTLYEQGYEPPRRETGAHIALKAQGLQELARQARGSDRAHGVRVAFTDSQGTAHGWEVLFTAEVQGQSRYLPTVRKWSGMHAESFQLLSTERVYHIRGTGDMGVDGDELSMQRMLSELDTVENFMRHYGDFVYVIEDGM